MVANSGQTNSNTKFKRFSLLRYPGGKGKLLRVIIPRLQQMFAETSKNAEFREPFFGGGAVGLSLLAINPLVRNVWINDRDPSMSALWHAVLHETESLQIMVDILPEAMRLFDDVDYYEVDTARLRSISQPSDVSGYPAGFVAAMKLASHQISYSGLGTCSGGPMSDRLSRYKPDRLNAKIETCREILGRASLHSGTCTCLDFEALLEPGPAVIYLDPPYYQKGPELYQFSFKQEDHGRLARRLKSETRPWLLSYDNHPAILKLYKDWTKIEEVEVACSINKCNKKLELLISNG